MPEIYGYLRVSTNSQDINVEKPAILMKQDELGIKGTINWVSEIVTGKKTWSERQLGILVNNMKEGDILLISEISRISRNMLDIMWFLSEASKKKIIVHICKGNIKIDNSMTSNILIFAYSLTSQIERELISERTKNGLAKAKLEGRKGGRPKGEAKKVKLDEHIIPIRKLIENGAKYKYIQEKYKCTYPTLKHFIERHNLHNRENKLVSTSNDKMQ